MSYRVSENILAAHLQGEAVLLDLVSKSYFRLNATAARVWQSLEKGLAEPEIVALLCSEYDVAPEDAAAELTGMIEELRQKQLISVADAPSAVPAA